MRRTLIFWGILIALPVAAILASIGTTAYWTVPKGPYVVQGQPLIATDPEIGYVPYPNTVTQRIDMDRKGNQTLSYHIFNDRRGARVSQPGEQAPAHPDIVFLGDSFTWGHGVENEQTFAHLVPLALGVTGANLAMAGHGTTESLLMLRRNLDLAPQLIVHTFTADHLPYSTWPCAPSYYPFCHDVAHVVWDKDGGPRIAPPWSDGTTRTQLQVKADHEWLDPLTWVVHGVDVAYGRILWSEANKTLSDGAKQNQAIEFLFAEMAKTAQSIGANLLFVHAPTGGQIPDVFVKSAAKLGVPLLDLSPVFQAHEAIPGAPPLTFPNDLHPNAAGHALIASEIASFIRQRGLLGQPSDAKASLSQTKP
jgi:hypothetical protein